MYYENSVEYGFDELESDPQEGDVWRTGSRYWFIRKTYSELTATPADGDEIFGSINVKFLKDYGAVRVFRKPNM